MTADGGYWASSGRHRPDRDPGDEEDYDQRAGYNGRSGGYQPGSGDYRAGTYEAGEHGPGEYGAGEYGAGRQGVRGGAADGYGRPDDYQASDGYGRPGGYGETSGYGEPEGYDRPAGYGESAGYSDPGYGQSRYGEPGYQEPGYGDSGYAEPRYAEPGYAEPGYAEPGYGEPGRYDAAGGYGVPRGYGEQADYDAPGGYGAPGGYPAPSGYPAPGGYGDPAGYGEAGEFQDQADYDSGPSGRGRHATGRASGRADASSTDPYGGAAYGEEGGLDRYGTGPHQEPGYASQDPYGQAGRLGLDSSNGQYGPAGGRRPAELGPGQDAGWDFRPEPAPYDSGALGDPGTGSFPQPDTGAFGRTESGTFARPDTGSFRRAESGQFARPDTGSFGRAESGAFPRAVPDSYGDDSAAFGRLDAGSFGADDEDESAGQLDSDNHDSGTIRWMSGPPPAKPRTDRNQADLPERGEPAGDPDGYAEWHDEPADDEWPDDAGGGLLSRRFGRGGGGGDSGGGRKRNRIRKRRGARGRAAFTVAIFVVILIVGIAAAVGYSFVNKWITNRYGDYAGAGTGQVQVTVPPGATLAGLGPALVSDGVIQSVRPYDTAAAAVGATLQPGVYQLHRHMNAALAVKYLLSSKDRIKDNVTIIEGTRASAIAAILAKQTGYKASQFTKIIDNPPSSLGLPSWAAGSTAEGFLFPDTYTLLPHETPLQILHAMVSEFTQKVASISLATEAAKVNTTPWHVLIVASMVQAESGPGDFGKVARVAWRRLGLGMALHFDSTVFYGLNEYGTAASSAQIRKDTPYNTYIHAGLPPGPIGNPGLEAIKAALHPPHGQWLYFITDLRHKPYVTHFTASYSQFQQWQKEFQG